MHLSWEDEARPGDLIAVIAAGAIGCESGAMIHRGRLVSSVLFGVLFACVPKRDLPPAEIQKLTSLEHVMDVQATIADPQFSKIGNGTYTDQDWAAFADVGSRLQVTSRKTKEFSKGPEFDAFADQLFTRAEALSAAASAKDPKVASATLAEIKSTCKACHSKFR